MAVVSTVRDSIKTRLLTISGLRAHDVWPGHIECPAALVKPMSMSEKQDMGAGGDRILEFEIILLAAPFQDDKGRGQDKLDSYLDETGANSIIAALQGTTGNTLAGTISANTITWSDYGQLMVDEGNTFWGAKFRLEVFP